MQNSGIPYFPLDCQLDEKFELIEAEFGLTGFSVVVKLFQRIYGRQGYYCEWTNEVALLFSKQCGLGCSVVSEIVSATIKRGIFDKDKYDKYSILTSKGIQERYFEAVSRRKSVFAKSEYLLLCNTKISKNVDISTENVYKNEKNVDIFQQSKEEKRKEEKSRVKQVACATLTDAQRQILIDEFGTASVTAYINKMERWRVKTNAKITNEFETLVQWLKKDCSENKADEHSSFDVDELERKTIEEYKEKCE